MNTQLYFYLFITTLLFACNAAETPTEDSTEQLTATFVANPQPVAKQEVKTLEIGATAPDFHLPGTDGKYYTLADFKEAKALAIVFTCNHCPTAQAYEARLKSVAADYQNQGLAVVAISPNSPLGLLYEELGYTDLNDDFEEMVIRTEDQQFNFPYLYDGDTEEASLKYGPVATPHVFLFDQDRKLAYVGRLDGVEKPGAANAEDMRAAVNAVLAGQPVTTPVTKTFGCSTKWGWKLDLKKKVNREWKEKPVELAKLDILGLQKLLKNEDSDKLRLLHIWASTNEVLEISEYIVLQRMFGARDFEFISIAADLPKQEREVNSILEDNYAACTNYFFPIEGQDELVEAVDPDWDGSLPYTLLIEPNGNVVWKHFGAVDFYELKRLIVEHEMIGRYY